MAENKIEVLLTAKDKASGAINKNTKAMKGMTGASKTLGDSFKALKGIAITAFVGWGVGGVAKSFLTAATTAEGFKVRLNTLLGGVKEGNRAFREMSKFAGEVPYKYEDIMAATTTLSGVMRDGIDEIKKWMPMIADLAAVSGLGIQETTSQIVRMYSAGAASADMFRERGILAMMGFKAGVSYTAEETTKIMFKSWEAQDSKFRGVTKDLAKTWEGIMSMIGDKWFQLRNIVMDAGIFDVLKERLEDFNDAFGDWIKNNEELIKQKIPEYAEELSKGLKSIAYAAEKTGRAMVVIIDIWKYMGPVGLGGIEEAIESYDKLIDRIKKTIGLKPSLEFYKMPEYEILTQAEKMKELLEKGPPIRLDFALKDPGRFFGEFPKEINEAFKKILADREILLATGMDKEILIVHQRYDKELKKLKEESQEYIELEKNRNIIIEQIRIKYRLEDEEKNAKYYAALAEMEENADIEAIMRERERLEELKPIIAKRHEMWLSAYEAEENRLDEYASYRTEQEKSIAEQIRSIRMKDKTFALAALKEKYENYKNFTDDLVGLELWRATEEKKLTEDKYGDMTNAMMGWANNFSSTLNDMLWGAEITFKSILESFMKMITQMLIQIAIIDPLVAGITGGGIWKGITGLFSGLFSAQGNVFSQSGLQNFAQGGIVHKPTQFAFAGGVGLMGEAGPEAIMPLTRTSRGDLGVKTVNGSSDRPQKQTINVILNNPVFQDLETQRQVMVQIASTVAAQVAPGAVVENFLNDGEIRQMVRGGM